MVNQTNKENFRLELLIHVCLRKSYQDNLMTLCCGGLVLVKCPRCGTVISTSTKEWDYSAFHVKRFDCKKCDKAFMAYYHEGKLSHTIPKRK